MKIGEKEAQRRAQREAALRPAKEVVPNRRRSEQVQSPKANKPVARTPVEAGSPRAGRPRFDRTAYQRELMRKRRARLKAQT